MGLHFWPLGGLVVGERNERSWNAIAQGWVVRLWGGAKRAELETEAVRAVSWLLVAWRVCSGFMCVVLAFILFQPLLGGYVNKRGSYQLE